MASITGSNISSTANKNQILFSSSISLIPNNHFSLFPKSEPRKFKKLLKFVVVKIIIQCKVSWDEVEEISQAKADFRMKVEKEDPLESFCNENPETDECRVYED
ncbi:hypothetical protein MKW98_012399 [Papaver atlanticum]|uniref:CP12 domain-containing protein n=1 Tax=Papaver atlanticum TaxID=357466 RepID=A0AAD4T349_9MAGN|nr:hypothetical protein MKW98_012399 [Papaver atlanticum]